MYPSATNIERGTNESSYSPFVSSMSISGRLLQTIITLANRLVFPQLNQLLICRHIHLLRVALPRTKLSFLHHRPNVDLAWLNTLLHKRMTV